MHLAREPSAGCGPQSLARRLLEESDPLEVGQGRDLRQNRTDGYGAGQRHRTVRGSQDSDCSSTQVHRGPARQVLDDDRSGMAWGANVIPDGRLELPQCWRSRPPSTGSGRLTAAIPASRGETQDMTAHAASPTRPEWQHCGDGADESNAVGCRGVRVSSYERCLAHLDDEDRQAYLSGLTSGGDADHRGTQFSKTLFDDLLAAMSASSGQAVFRKALFDEAEFEGDVDLSRAIFHDEAAFRRARFKGKAVFSEAEFRGISSFRKAIFESSAQFGSAEFAKPARFGEVEFQGHAGFNGSKFSNVARFESAAFADVATFTRAVFAHNARFDTAVFHRPTRFAEVAFKGEVDFSGVKSNHRISFGGANFAKDVRFVDFESLAAADFSSTSFSGDANFEGAHFFSDALFAKSSFEKLAHFGPVVVKGKVDLSFAVFRSPITFEISSAKLVCRRTRFDATATCRS